MIRVDQFKGENKKISPHLLPNEQGEIVLNANVRTGQVQGLRMPADVAELPITRVRSIWQYIDGENKHWCYSTACINAVRSPIIEDHFSRLYFTGGESPAAFANDIKSDPFDCTADFYKLGVKTPVSAPTFVSGHTGGATYRGYVFTYVSRYGEEGPPSPVLSTTTYNTGSVVLTGFTDPGDEHLTDATESTAHKPMLRIYRTNSSTAGVGAFQFVKEVYTSTFTWGTGQITDDVADANLGEVLPSLTWEEPPSDLIGLTGMPIGCMAGFTSNTVYFTELFLPHAWNPEYAISFKETVVGLGVLGTSLIVLTDEVPYIINGSHPSNFTKTALSAYYPCLSKEGIVSIDGGVLYPSREGIILATRNGCSNITKDLMEMSDMDLLVPSTWRASFFNGQYIAFWENSTLGTTGGIILDMNESALISLDTYRGALYVSLDDNKLYVGGRLVPSDSVESIQEWEGDTVNYFNFTWKSKKFIVDKAVNFSTARVIIDPVVYQNILLAIAENDYLEDLNFTLFGEELEADITGAALNEYAMNGDTLFELNDLSLTPYTNVKVYCDEILRFSKNINTNSTFRLPAGFRGKIWQFEINGFVPVQGVVIGGSVREVMGNA